MKKVFLKIIIICIPLYILISLGLILPETPMAKQSLLFSSIQKDSLLLHTPPPRIIFIGGSNLSMSLNSNMIKDSLGLNPINTGIHMDLGLRYMFENTIQYVQKGDIIVLIPEYVHFFRNYDYVSEELLRMIFDVNLNNIKHLSFIQIIKLFQFVPKYALSKFNPSEYYNYIVQDYYTKSDYNVFGDAVKHWGFHNRRFQTGEYYKNRVNSNVINKIKQLKQEVEKRNATFLISYPAFDKTSYSNAEKNIIEVEDSLKRNNFSIIGTPKRYTLSDSIFFDSPYHLNKIGAYKRTEYLISDLKEYFGNK